MISLSRDGFLGRKIEVFQPRNRAHRAGLDAVLLASTVPRDAMGLLIDLGAGVGVAGLCAAVRCPAIAVSLVEIDPELVDLADRNIALNRTLLGSRVSAIEADVTAPPAELEGRGLKAHSARHVICNPPFHMAERVRPSPMPDRARAHVIDTAHLSHWLRTALYLLHPKGSLTLIFRADEAPRLLGLVAATCGALTLLPVYPRAGAAAHRILLSARPNSKAPFRLLPGLIVHEEDGRFTAGADAVLQGGGLPLF